MNLAVLAAKRRKVAVLLLGRVVSNVNSTFVAAAFAPAADGVTTDALTLTVEDAGGNPLAGRAVTFTVQRVFVDAAQTTVAALPLVIANDGTETATVTVTARASDDTPLPRIPAASVVLASTGSNNTIGQPSTATNYLGGTTGTLASTTAEAKTVSATVCGQAITDTATVTVSGAGPSAVFASDWSTATGTSLTAIQDGSTWDNYSCASSLLDVVAGSGVGFTETTNVLRCDLDGVNCRLIQKQEAVPASTTHWGRIYFRSGLTSTINLDHILAYNNIHGGTAIQAVPFALWRASGAPSAGRWKMGVFVNGGGYPYNRWASPELDNDTWYRIEWEMEYVSATYYRMWPRIYSLAGTLLYDSDDFGPSDGQPGTLTAFNGDNPAGFELAGVLNGGSADATLARRFGLGNNGPNQLDSGQSWYFAKVGLSTDGWLGA